MHAHVNKGLIIISFLFISVLGVHLNAQAQTGSIEGAIVHKDSGIPIPGINIIVKGTDIGTAADSDGSFILLGVPVGLQTLVVSGIGYENQEKEIRVRESRRIQLEILLSEDVLELSEIEVVDRRRTFDAQYNQTKTNETVDEETARKFNSTNAYDALRIVPGLSYGSGAGNRFGKPTKIRGGSAWAIADVIEEFPSVRESAIGAEDGGLKADFGSSIPSIALQDIEVKKGSQGVLYSGNADGGVIVNNIKQGQPGEPQGTIWLESNPINEQLIMGDIGGATESFDYYLAENG